MDPQLSLVCLKNKVPLPVVCNYRLTTHLPKKKLYIPPNSMVRDF